MTDSINCPTCLTFNNSSPLTLDAESGNFFCVNSHAFTPEQVAELVVETPVAVATPKRKPGRPAKKEKSGENLSQGSVDNLPHLSQVLDKWEAEEGSSGGLSPLSATSETSNDLAVLQCDASGDVVLSLKVRENYAGALIDLASEEKLPLQELVQRRLDWWLENEFAPVKYI